MCACIPCLRSGPESRGPRRRGSVQRMRRRRRQTAGPRTPLVPPPQHRLAGGLLQHGRAAGLPSGGSAPDWELQQRMQRMQWLEALQPPCTKPQLMQMPCRRRRRRQRQSLRRSMQTAATFAAAAVLLMSAGRRRRRPLQGGQPAAVPASAPAWPQKAALQRSSRHRQRLRSAGRPSSASSSRRVPKPVTVAAAVVVLMVKGDCRRCRGPLPTAMLPLQLLRPRAQRPGAAAAALTSRPTALGSQPLQAEAEAEAGQAAAAEAEAEAPSEVVAEAASVQTQAARRPPGQAVLLQLQSGLLALPMAASPAEVEAPAAAGSSSNMRSDQDQQQLMPPHGHLLLPLPPQLRAQTRRRRRSRMAKAHLRHSGRAGAAMPAVWRQPRRRRHQLQTACRRPAGGTAGTARLQQPLPHQQVPLSMRMEMASKPRLALPARPAAMTAVV